MSPQRSEDVIGAKWDKCISNTLLKFGGGLAVGAVASLLLFKRRSWPIVFGAGAGFGMGYNNCQHLLDEPYLVKPEKITIVKKIAETKEEASL